MSRMNNKLDRPQLNRPGIGRITTQASTQPNLVTTVNRPPVANYSQYTTVQPPDSPPDAMDLVRPDFINFQNNESPGSGGQTQTKSNLRTIRNLHPAGRGSHSQTFIKVVTSDSNKVTSSNTNTNVPNTSRNVSVQGSAIKSRVTPQSQATRNSLSTPNSDGDSGIKKLSPQELERMRINRASDFYRQQREKYLEMSQKSSTTKPVSEPASNSELSSIPDQSVLMTETATGTSPSLGIRTYRPPPRIAKVSPLGSTPPPPAVEELTSTPLSTTASLRASRIVKIRQPNLDNTSNTSIISPPIQTRVVCYPEAVGGFQESLQQEQVLVSPSQMTVPMTTSYVQSSQPLYVSTTPSQMSTTLLLQNQSPVMVSSQTNPIMMPSQSTTSTLVQMVKPLPNPNLNSGGQTAVVNRLAPLQVNSSLAVGNELRQSPVVLPRRNIVYNSSTPGVELSPSEDNLQSSSAQNSPSYQSGASKVTKKTFTQHWVRLGKDFPVLLLDFNRDFSLLIPNIEPGKSFSANTTSLELLTKTLATGQPLTFMKFLFDMPVLTIEAPVLNDRQVMYRILKQNSACVLLGSVLTEVRKPSPPPPQPQVEYVEEYTQAEGVTMVTEGNTTYILDMPKLPPGTIIVPQEGGNVQMYQSLIQGEQYYITTAPQEVCQTTDLINSFTADSQEVVTNQFVSSQTVLQPMDNQQDYANTQNFIPDVNHFSPQPETTLVSTSLEMSGPGPTASLPPVETISKFPNSPANRQTMTTASTSVSSEMEQTGPIQMIFPDMITDPIYKALKPDELGKILFCRYCHKKFTFLSEHMVHMKIHTSDVESATQMYINIWIQNRKLKCDHCKNKYSYTLDYARHVDTHPILGLSCRICQCGVANPTEYGEHMEIHHHSVIFSLPPVDNTIPQSETEQMSQNNFSVSNQPDVMNSMMVGQSGDSNSGGQMSAMMVHGHEDVMNEEEVLEALLEGERNAEQSPITLQPPQQQPPPPVMQTPVSTNVDMPILEAPVTTAQTLNQQDEDFLRDLTSFDFSSNQPKKDEYQQQNSSTTTSHKSEQLQEESVQSIDESVSSLARDLVGKIASQSFGFDKEDSISFGFSDDEEDSGKTDKKNAQTRAGQTEPPPPPTFENCLSKGSPVNFQPTPTVNFSPSIPNVVNHSSSPAQPMLSNQSMPSIMNLVTDENSKSFRSSEEPSIDDPESDFSDRLSPAHRTPSLSSLQQQNPQNFTNISKPPSMEPQSMPTVVDDFDNLVGQSVVNNSLKSGITSMPPCNQNVELANEEMKAGSRDQTVCQDKAESTIPEKAAALVSDKIFRKEDLVFGGYEEVIPEVETENKCEPEEDLDLQLYLSDEDDDNDEQLNNETGAKVNGPPDQMFSNSNFIPQPQPVSPQLDNQKVLVEPVPQVAVLSRAFLNSSGASIASPKQFPVQPQEQNCFSPQSAFTPLHKSDSSPEKVEEHICDYCKNEFRTRKALLIHRTKCNKVDPIIEQPAKKVDSPIVSPTAPGRHIESSMVTPAVRRSKTSSSSRSSDEIEQQKIFSPKGSSTGGVRLSKTSSSNSSSESTSDEVEPERKAASPLVSPPASARQSKSSSSSSASDEDEQDKQCEYCNDRFRSLPSLKMHKFICRKKSIGTASFDHPPPQMQQPAQPVLQSDQPVNKPLKSPQMQTPQDLQVFDFEPVNSNDDVRGQDQGLKLKISKILSPKKDEERKRKRQQGSTSNDEKPDTKKAAATSKIYNHRPSFLANHLAKYSHPKKTPEPVEVTKPEVPENTATPSHGLKLKINLKKAIKPEKKGKRGPKPIQQPILGKLVVRKKNSAPRSRSILFPPVPSMCRDEFPENESPKKEKKKRKKDRKKDKPDDSYAEEKKVPKLVIKRDAIRPVVVEPLVPKTDLQNVLIVKKLRGVSRSGSTCSTDSSQPDSWREQLNKMTCAVAIENLRVKTLADDAVVPPTNENGDVVKLFRKDLKLLSSTPKEKKHSRRRGKEKTHAPVPKLKIKLGPAEEPGKLLSVILSDLSHDTEENISTSARSAIDSPSYDEILKLNPVAADEIYSDETCLVEGAGMDSALQVLLSYELKEDIVGQILDDVLTSVVSQKPINNCPTLGRDNLFEKTETDELLLNKDSPSNSPEKMGLKLTLGRKEDKIVILNSDPTSPKKLSKKCSTDLTSKFAVIRVPRLKARLKRSGSGLSGSDYRRRSRGGRRKLDKIIIKNVSRPASMSTQDSNDFVEGDDARQICESIIESLIDACCSSNLNDDELAIDQEKVLPVESEPVKRKKGRPKSKNIEVQAVEDVNSKTAPTDSDTHVMTRSRLHEASAVEEHQSDTVVVMPEFTEDKNQRGRKSRRKTEISQDSLTTTDKPSDLANNSDVEDSPSKSKVMLRKSSRRAAKEDQQDETEQESAHETNVASNPLRRIEKIKIVKSGTKIVAIQDLVENLPQLEPIKCGKSKRNSVEEATCAAVDKIGTRKLNRKAESLDTEDKDSKEDESESVIIPKSPTINKIVIKKLSVTGETEKLSHAICSSESLVEKIKMRRSNSEKKSEKSHKEHDESNQSITTPKIAKITIRKDSISFNSSIVPDPDQESSPKIAKIIIKKIQGDDQLLDENSSKRHELSPKSKIVQTSKSDYCSSDEIPQQRIETIKIKKIGKSAALVKTGTDHCDVKPKKTSSKQKEKSQSDNGKIVGSSVETTEFDKNVTPTLKLIFEQKKRSGRFKTAEVLKDLVVSIKRVDKEKCELAKPELVPPSTKSNQDSQILSDKAEMKVNHPTKKRLNKQLGGPVSKKCKRNLKTLETSASSLNEDNMGHLVETQTVTPNLLKGGKMLNDNSSKDTIITSQDIRKDILQPTPKASMDETLKLEQTKPVITQSPPPWTKKRHLLEGAIHLNDKFNTPKLDIQPITNISLPLLPGLQNPPFFARKSAPKPIEDEVESQTLDPKLSEPNNHSGEGQKTSGVIKSALEVIRKTPDTRKMFSMIDNLFEDVMVTFKADETVSDETTNLPKKNIGQDHSESSDTSLDAKSLHTTKSSREEAKPIPADAQEQQADVDSDPQSQNENFENISNYPEIHDTESQSSDTPEDLSMSSANYCKSISRQESESDVIANKHVSLDEADVNVNDYDDVDDNVDDNETVDLSETICSSIANEIVGNAIQFMFDDDAQVVLVETEFASDAINEESVLDHTSCEEQEYDSSDEANEHEMTYCEQSEYLEEDNDEGNENTMTDDPDIRNEEEQNDSQFKLYLEEDSLQNDDDLVEEICEDSQDDEMPSNNTQEFSDGAIHDLHESEQPTSESCILKNNIEHENQVDCGNKISDNSNVTFSVCQEPSLKLSDHDNDIVQDVETEHQQIEEEIAYENATLSSEENKQVEDKSSEAVNPVENTGAIQPTKEAQDIDIHPKISNQDEADEKIEESELVQESPEDTEIIEDSDSSSDAHSKDIGNEKHQHLNQSSSQQTTDKSELIEELSNSTLSTREGLQADTSVNIDLAEEVDQSDDIQDKQIVNDAETIDEIDKQNCSTQKQFKSITVEEPTTEQSRDVQTNESDTSQIQSDVSEEPEVVEKDDAQIGEEIVSGQDYSPRQRVDEEPHGDFPINEIDMTQQQVSNDETQSQNDVENQVESNNIVVSCHSSDISKSNESNLLEEQSSQVKGLPQELTDRETSDFQTKSSVSDNKCKRISLVHDYSSDSSEDENETSDNEDLEDRLQDSSSYEAGAQVEDSSSILEDSKESCANTITTKYPNSELPTFEEQNNLDQNNASINPLENINMGLDFTQNLQADNETNIEQVFSPRSFKDESDINQEEQSNIQPNELPINEQNNGSHFQQNEESTIEDHSASIEPDIEQENVSDEPPNETSIIKQNNLTDFCTSDETIMEQDNSNLRLDNDSDTEHHLTDDHSLNEPEIENDERFNLQADEQSIVEQNCLIDTKTSYESDTEQEDMSNLISTKQSFTEQNCLTDPRPTDEPDNEPENRIDLQPDEKSSIEQNSQTSDEPTIEQEDNSNMEPIETSTIEQICLTDHQTSEESDREQEECSNMQHNVTSTKEQNCLTDLPTSDEPLHSDQDEESNLKLNKEFSTGQSHLTYDDDVTSNEPNTFDTPPNQESSLKCETTEDRCDSPNMYPNEEVFSSEPPNTFHESCLNEETQSSKHENEDTMNVEEIIQVNESTETGKQSFDDCLTGEPNDLSNLQLIKETDGETNVEHEKDQKDSDNTNPDVDAFIEQDHPIEELESFQDINEQSQLNASPDCVEKELHAETVESQDQNASNKIESEAALNEALKSPNCQEHDGEIVDGSSERNEVLLKSEIDQQAEVLNKESMAIEETDILNCNEECVAILQNQNEIVEDEEVDHVSDIKSQTECPSNVTEANVRPTDENTMESISKVSDFALNIESKHSTNDHPVSIANPESFLKHKQKRRKTSKERFTKQITRTRPRNRINPVTAKLVDDILNDSISAAVNQSETVNRTIISEPILTNVQSPIEVVSSPELILTNVKPPMEIVSTPESRMSTDLGTDVEEEQQQTLTDAEPKLGSRLQYQEEMSIDQVTHTTMKKISQRSNISKKASPFSRSSYAKRRGQKRPLPISSLERTSSPSVSSKTMAPSSGDVCSSPSNTESGKENDVNFSTDKKPQPKKEVSLNPEIDAIFVRDEFDSTGDDIVNLGKGKRKRFLNVRMFPIGETMSQKLQEISQSFQDDKDAAAAAKKSKPNVVEHQKKIQASANDSFQGASNKLERPVSVVERLPPLKLKLNLHRSKSLQGEVASATIVPQQTRAFEGEPTVGTLVHPKVEELRKKGELPSQILQNQLKRLGGVQTQFDSLAKEPRLLEQRRNSDPASLPSQSLQMDLKRKRHGDLEESSKKPKLIEERAKSLDERPGSAPGFFSSQSKTVRIGSPKTLAGQQKEDVLPPTVAQPTKKVKEYSDTSSKKSTDKLVKTKKLKQSQKSEATVSDQKETKQQRRSKNKSNEKSKLARTTSQTPGSNSRLVKVEENPPKKRKPKVSAETDLQKVDKSNPTKMSKVTKSNKNRT